MNQVKLDGTETTLIHYCHISSDKEQIACMPNMTEFHLTGYHPNYQRSNDTRAVTCLACKKSDIYMHQQRALGYAKKA